VHSGHLGANRQMDCWTQTPIWVDNRHNRKIMLDCLYLHTREVIPVFTLCNPDDVN